MPTNREQSSLNSGLEQNQYQERDMKAFYDYRLPGAKPAGPPPEKKGFRKTTLTLTNAIIESNGADLPAGSKFTFRVFLNGRYQSPSFFGRQYAYDSVAECAAALADAKASAKSEVPEWCGELCKTGVKLPGATRHKTSIARPWRSQAFISGNGTTHLGCFATELEAHCATEAALLKLGKIDRPLRELPGPASVARYNLLSTGVPEGTLEAARQVALAKLAARVKAAKES